MSKREAFERILASLHEAALNREVWSTATGLIDDALRTHGSSMLFGEGTSYEDARIYFAWYYSRGQGHPERVRAYFEEYWRRDERVPRLRRLPDGRLFHTTELYTEEELKTSAAYNELLVRQHVGNAINVRLDGPDDTRIVWVVNDPIDGDRWSSDQLKFIRYLLPHIRQTVHMQQALAGAGALGASHGQLLDTTGLGVVQLNARARIVAANDRARDLLRRGEALFDEHGFLHARMPEEDAELQGLLTRALPPYGAQGAGGSTMLSRSSAPPLVLHVNPVGPRESDARVWPVAALVLVIDPASQSRIDPAVAAAALGLTEMEGRVAALLAEGMNVREIAAEHACCPANFGIPPKNRQISPIWRTRAKARLANLSFIPIFKLGARELGGNATHASVRFANYPRDVCREARHRGNSMDFHDTRRAERWTSPTGAGCKANR